MFKINRKQKMVELKNVPIGGMFVKVVNGIRCNNVYMRVTTPYPTQEDEIEVLNLNTGEVITWTTNCLVNLTKECNIELELDE